MEQPTSILKSDRSDHGHPNQTPPGDEPPPNLPPRKASRPRLQLPALNIPSRPTMAPLTAGTATTAGTVTWGPAHHGHVGHPYLGQPYYPNMPMTPTSGIMGGPTGVPIGMAGALGRFNVYPTKASEFMFKQFAGELGPGQAVPVVPVVPRQPRPIDQLSIIELMNALFGSGVSGWCAHYRYGQRVALEHLEGTAHRVEPTAEQREPRERRGWG